MRSYAYLAIKISLNGIFAYLISLTVGLISQLSGVRPIFDLITFSSKLAGQCFVDAC